MQIATFQESQAAQGKQIAVVREQAAKAERVTEKAAAQAAQAQQELAAVDAQVHAEVDKATTTDAKIQGVLAKLREQTAIQALLESGAENVRELLREDED